MRLTRRRALLTLGAGVVGAGCNTTPPGSQETPTPAPGLEEWSGYDPDWAALSTAPPTLDYEVIVENLRIPWDFAFASTGELFITERPGRIIRIENGTREGIASPDIVDATAIEPGEEGGWWSTGGEDGLLGIAIHPEYPDQPYVYAYYTYPAGDDKFNRVVRYDVTATDVEATEEILVDRIPGGDYHDGGRLQFGPRGFLWITTGDGGQPALARDPGALGGKLLRVTPTGDAAPGNPGLADPRVYSYGHRNPQGIAWLPDGRPVSTEHGPTGKDEVMLPARGGDHGWPDVRTADAYRAASGVHPPVLNTGGGTTWAPSGTAVSRGEAVPGLRNRLLVACLGGQRCTVITLTRSGEETPPVEEPGAERFDADWLDDTLVATAHRRLVDALGRVRAVDNGPDGFVYATTSNRDGRARDPFPLDRDDVLVRLTAA